MAANTHALERQGSSLSPRQRGGAAPRRLRLAGLAALLAALPSGEALATTAERVFAAVSPSVVVVEVEEQRGSGVVVAARVVATNCHVIGKAERITVRRGRIGHAASLVRSDRDRDVCLVEVPTLEAPPVNMRPAADLRVGTAVYAVGAPQGLELSLSAGLVSQLRGSEGGPLIQTTAPVSPGSWGEGLFDERGRLVGLTSFQLGRGQNLNFAVPVEWVAAAVNELVAWRRCRAAPEPQCVIEEALAAARGISEQSSRSEALMSIAEAQARAGDRQSSARTFASALAAAREIAHPGDRSWALRDIAEAQAGAGDIPGAMATLREITDLRHRLQVLSAIAEAQARAGDRQSSARTFASALAAAREIAHPGDRSWALRDIAKAQAGAGDIPGAMATAREIADRNMASWTLISIASAQAGAGDRQASGQTLASALATAREIVDPMYRSRALRDIAEAQARAGDIPGAIGTSREIADPRDRSRALRDIAEAQAWAGDIPGAMATAREIADWKMESWALISIASAQARAGDIPGAMATTRQIADPFYRSLALSAIAEAEASARDGINGRLIGMAFEAIDGLTIPNARAAALARAAAALASARQESSNAR